MTASQRYINFQNVRPSKILLIMDMISTMGLLIYNQTLEVADHHASLLVHVTLLIIHRPATLASARTLMMAEDKLLVE